MKTSKWPIFVLIAYFVINILIILGLTNLLFFDFKIWKNTVGFLPFALIVAGVMLICQFFLFFIKVDVVEKRPVPKRKINVASIFIALLMAVLTFTAFILLFFVVKGETHSGLIDSELFLFLLFFGSWILWAYVFLTRYNKNFPETFIKKTVSTLMVGSILELIIAIPSHIIFRNRDDCCTPLYSYFGIVMGTTVLLFAFGPGVIFLYLKRINDKRSKKAKI